MLIIYKKSKFNRKKETKIPNSLNIIQVRFKMINFIKGEFFLSVREKLFV